MAKFIPFDDFMPHASDDVGVEVNVNHDNCGAGYDTKKRLYINRKNRDTVTAYCHHCGLSGVWRSNRSAHWTELDGYMGGLETGGTTVPPKTDTVSLQQPHPATGDLSEWPPEAFKWVYKAGIQEEEIAKYGLKYLPKDHRVMIPSYSQCGNLVQYQTRKLFDWDKRPKYLSVKVDNFVGYDTICSGSNIKTPNTDTIVIVEDKLSAYKVSRICDCLCILSSNLNDKAIQYIYSNYSNVKVMLDNDNLDIMNKQLQIKKKLEPLVSGSVDIIRLEKDPKDFTTEELRELLL